MLQRKKFNYPLHQIARIKTGVYCNPSNTGNAWYLQAADLKADGCLSGGLKPTLYLEGKLQDRLLKKNDVLFMAKGVNNLALAYDPKTYGALIPSTAFLIISNSNSGVLPGYIAWYINQPPAQQYLKAQAKGSSPPSITVKTLGELEIHIPDIETQKIILKIHDLRMREKQLKSDIEHLKEKILNHQLSKAIRK